MISFQDLSRIGQTVRLVVQVLVIVGLSGSTLGMPARVGRRISVFPADGVPIDATSSAGATKVFLPFVTKEAGTTPPLTNLLSNGTFENGNLSGWEATGVSVSQAQAHEGKWSARLANSGMRTWIPTSPGQVYKVTAWIKITSESGSDWGGFRIAVYDGNWNTLDDTGSLVTATHGSDWFKVALTFTAAGTSTPMDVGYFGGPGRTLVAHVDDIRVFAKAPNRMPQVTATLSPTNFSELPQTQQYSLIGDDPDGAIVRVLWEFGDGARMLNWSGTRRVALPGSYVAKVSVADDEGAVVASTIAWTAIASGFPSLVVTSPAALESTVNTAVVMLSGTTTGSVSKVQVSSDRGYMGTASGTSAWSTTVMLQPGLNQLLIQAQGTAGRVVTGERWVRYVPPGALSVSGLTNPPTVERWDVLEVTFTLNDSAATDSQFPYDPDPPPGLKWMDGVTAEALFTPDNWNTIYRRPAFLYQPYQRALKDNSEWLYPVGNPDWMVRFAPPTLGSWKYRIEVREARGTAQSAEGTFAVTPPTNPNNHGPVRVAPNDSRYFEFADGTPFLGAGHSTGYSAHRFSYDAVDEFDTIGSGNQDFFRWWLGGNIWASAWQPWRSRTLSYDGYIPATGLTLEQTYGDGLVSLRLDSANPIMFYGFDSGRPGLIPGRTYRLRIRWRTENVTGPGVAGQPYGLTAKLTGWPEPGQTNIFPVLIPHVNGDTPWHVAEADIVATADLLPNFLSLILENTTGGVAYVDDVALYEVLGGGGLGSQLLRNPRFNSQLTFDPLRGAGMDAIFAEANARGMYYKLVISEKNEFILSRLGPEGLPDVNGGHFDEGEGSPTHWLHEAYWRHLFARFGAYRSIHSWELVNEAGPGPGAHFRLAGDLATQATADGNPHLASTSTWATLAEDAWKASYSAPISYVDFHAYVRGTGWIEPKDALANDSARFFNEYDLAARAASFGKPVVWGEQGINGTNGTYYEDPALADDVAGVWLHKMTWARCGPGGVYPLYWYIENIFRKSLHPIYGAWKRFMTGIPLTNGRYQDAEATASNPDLRVLGQKDLRAGWAHLWIDNRQDTWRAVVDGTPISPVSGTVIIGLQRPNATYLVTWYSTQTGWPTATQTRSAGAGGKLTLVISGLSTDTAVRITRTSP